MEYILNDEEMQKIKAQLALTEALSNEVNELTLANNNLKHLLKVERSTTSLILAKVNKLNKQIESMSKPTRITFNELV